MINRWGIICEIVFRGMWTDIYVENEKMIQVLALLPQHMWLYADMLRNIFYSRFEQLPSISKLFYQNLCQLLMMNKSMFSMSTFFLIFDQFYFRMIQTFKHLRYVRWSKSHRCRPITEICVKVQFNTIFIGLKINWFFFQRILTGNSV